MEYEIYCDESRLDVFTSKNNSGRCKKSLSKENRGKETG